MAVIFPPHNPDLPVVAFDLDGTLAENLWPSPSIGQADDKAIEAVIHYFDQGCEVIVFTARPESHFKFIWRWLEDVGLDGYVYDVTNRKTRAGLMFDDRAVRWPLGD